MEKSHSYDLTQIGFIDESISTILSILSKLLFKIRLKIPKLIDNYSKNLFSLFKSRESLVKDDFVYETLRKSFTLMATKKDFFYDS